MDVQALAQQFQGASLAKLVEKQIRSSSEDQLLAAIQGTYENFPEHFRQAADTFSLNYAGQNWFGPQLASGDLSDLFLAAVRDAKNFASEQAIPISDEQAFDLFNLAVLRLSYFAHSRPNFRKQFGIKKGWFS